MWCYNVSKTPICLSDTYGGLFTPRFFQKALCPSAISLAVSLLYSLSSISSVLPSRLEMRLAWNKLRYSFGLVCSGVIYGQSDRWPRWLQDKNKVFGGQGVCSGADDSSGGVSGFLAGKGLRWAAGAVLGVGGVVGAGGAVWYKKAPSG